MQSVLLACLALGALAASALAADPMPAFHPNDVIVFQGDSIIDGGWLRSGDDHNHTMGRDYVYMIAGQVGAQLPECHLHFLNRGIGSENVANLAALWDGVHPGYHGHYFLLAQEWLGTVNTFYGDRSRDSGVSAREREIRL